MSNIQVINSAKKMKTTSNIIKAEMFSKCKNSPKIFNNYFLPAAQKCI
jgi:hypothetical protein